MKNPGGALAILAKIGTSAVFKDPKAAPSTVADVRNFHHAGIGLYLGNGLGLQIHKREVLRHFHPLP